MTSHDLFLSDFPLYCVFPFGPGEFGVTGGGGKSKTGVPNALEIRTLSVSDGVIGSKCIFRHDLGTDIIMNSVSHPNDLCTLAAGIGPSCHLLHITRDGLRSGERFSSISDLMKTGKIFVKDTGSVRTDFSEKDSYQKVVSFSHDGSRLVTGGIDGVVRVLKTPDLKELYKLRGHTDEIEGVSCHPTKLEVVSVCRSGDANVWDTAKGKQLKRFNWGTEIKPKYRFRSCCFSPKPKSKEDPPVALYTINIPSKWDHRAKKYCYLVKWDPTTWKAIGTSKAGKELLSALATNSSGSKVAIGTTEGSVAIYNSELKLLQRVAKTHSFFVTSLAFVTQSSNEDKLSAKDEVLLSVSADRTCCVTSASKKGGYWTVVFFCLLPFITFLFSMAVLWILVI